MQPIRVDCTFGADGTVRVRRIAFGERWQVVEQGRQWLDEQGRHVLVMLDGSQVREIVLRREELSWVLLPAGPSGPVAV